MQKKGQDLHTGLGVGGGGVVVPESPIARVTKNGKLKRKGGKICASSR